MKTKRLLWQLFPVNLLITLGALLIMTWYAASTAKDLYLEQMRQGLESRAHLIGKQVVDLALTSPEILQEFCQQAGRNSSTRITVVSVKGTVLADSNEDPIKMSDHSNRPELITALSGKLGSSVRYSNTLEKDMLYIAIPLTPYSSQFKGALRLSVPTSSIDSDINSIYLKVGIGCVLVIFIAGIITLLVSRMIVRPLEDMKLGAERLAKGETDHLLEVDTKSMSTEVYGLAKSLNRMAKQIRERINTITLQHNELKTVFSSMAEMVLAIDSDKKIIRLNSSAAALFHLSPDDVKGKVLHGVIHNKDLHEIIDEVLKLGNPVEKNIVLFVGPDKIYLQTRAVPLEDDQKKPIGVLVVLNNMTRLHKLENLRRDFVANVSHELMTPLTSIKGYTETILDGSLEDKEQTEKFLHIILRQSDRLQAIVSDLLKLSRIENEIEYNEIHSIPTNIKDVLGESIQVCNLKAAEKDITIELDCPDDLIASVDSQFIEQAIVNLLINAIKYSDPSSLVEIKAGIRTVNGTEMVDISVQDFGVGIGQEHLPRLFERFYRSDKARSRELGGTGLGLAIVKHIVQAHNGIVNVESEVGQGTKFTILIPTGSQ